MLAPILAGVYGTTGLFLRAHETAPDGFPANLLANVVDLALDEAQILRGGLACAPDELPLAGESCKLVVVQHLLERVDDPAACMSEIARVLAPEGVLLVLGFNPLSLWRPWLAGTARRVRQPMRIRSAQSWATTIGAQGIDVLQTRYSGAWSPWSAPAAEPVAAVGAVAAALTRLRGGWLLLARKRRSVLTPLRLRRDARELARNPRLAPGAHRECAHALASIEEKCA
ncbi:MAG: methyltransferase domain-containing protein [Proteobacteria bacterium]|uniref:methyltransferase domain-containing protein n=1 Tax=Rudaea sp. TaxID=2136325 RepID=UPI003220442E|nr:methyltransferase domain-containing protein [Pseudomonadota bacterium]